MKVYIWHRVAHLTSNYHHDGGLVIAVDGDLECARQALRDDPKYMEMEKEYPNLPPCEAFYKDPDLVLVSRPDAAWEINGGTCPMVLMFPDAGCC